MASSYTISEAVRIARLWVKNIPVNTIDITASDEILSKIWRYYPWRWSTVALTPIALVDGTQDYSSAPTNYFRLLRARIVRTDCTPDLYFEPLHIVNKLEPCLTKCACEGIQSIAYEGHLDKFRLEWAASVGTSVTYQLQGEYQKQPTRIADTSVALPFPDLYFDVFVAGLKWKFMEFADDARAGGSQTNGKGASGHGGARAEFEDALYMMACSEGYAAGDLIAPSESLMSG